jgi:hypothetical protein
MKIQLFAGLAVFVAGCTLFNAPPDARGTESTDPIDPGGEKKGASDQNPPQDFVVVKIPAIAGDPRDAEVASDPHDAATRQGGGFPPR